MTIKAREKPYFPINTLRHQQKELKHKVGQMYCKFMIACTVVDEKAHIGTKQHLTVKSQVYIAL